MRRTDEEPDEEGGCCLLLLQVHVQVMGHNTVAAACTRYMLALNDMFFGCSYHCGVR
jgi:hypothetical protein